MSRTIASFVAATTLLVDQLSKLAVRAWVGEFEVVALIPGCLNVIRSTNKGIAFGIFSNSSSPWTGVGLALVGSAVMLLIGWLLWHSASTPGQSRTSLALALILGGAGGNLLDRLLRGEVTDFLDFYIGGWHWYTFNVADAAITVAAALLFVDILLPHRGVESN